MGQIHWALTWAVLLPSAGQKKCQETKAVHLSQHDSLRPPDWQTQPLEMRQRYAAKLGKERGSEGVHVSGKG